MRRKLFISTYITENLVSKQVQNQKLIPHKNNCGSPKYLISEMWPQTLVRSTELVKKEKLRPCQMQTRN